MSDKTNTAEAQAQSELNIFLSAVSHDLRTPVRHIQSFAELLTEHLQESMDDQSKHYLDAISKSAADMDVMINSLISLFKINDSVLNIERIDLNVLVNEVVNSFQPETSGRIIEWEIGRLPVINSDLSMLRAVMTNLISNALKFTRLQKIAKIRIAFEPSQDDADCLVLSIKDNGVGFDMQNKDKLFDVLQKMHNNKDFEGIGNGLALVKRIVQKLGGTVQATGELDHGAVFYVTLPVIWGKENYATY